MGSKVLVATVNIVTYASEAIKKDLLAGTTIVVDRYVYSGVAFSAAKVVTTWSVFMARAVDDV